MSKIIKYASVVGEPVFINNHRPVLELVPEIVTVSQEPDFCQEARREAEDILYNARQQGEDIINTALMEADHLKQQACEAGQQEGHQTGYDEGIRQGKEQAADDMRDEIERAVEKAQQIIAAAQQEYQESVVAAEREIVEIALGVARKILAREIEENPTVVLPIVRAALEKVRDQEQMVIRVNPADFDLVIQAKRDLQMMIGRENAISVIHDHTVSPGGCMIDTPYGTVDASIDSQFDAIKTAIQGIMP